MITITSKTDGFRRCGVAHSAAATQHPNDRFTKEQLETLINEPELIVTVNDGGAAQVGSSEPGQSALNANDTIALVMAVTSLAELDKLSEGETRKGVLTAIAKKRTELEAGALNDNGGSSEGAAEPGSIN